MRSLVPIPLSGPLAIERQTPRMAVRARVSGIREASLAAGAPPRPPTPVSAPQSRPSNREAVEPGPSDAGSPEACQPDRFHSCFSVRCVCLAFSVISAPKASRLDHNHASWAVTTPSVHRYRVAPPDLAPTSRRASVEEAGLLRDSARSVAVDAYQTRD